MESRQGLEELRRRFRAEYDRSQLNVDFVWAAGTILQFSAAVVRLWPTGTVTALALAALIAQSIGIMLAALHSSQWYLRHRSPIISLVRISRFAFHAMMHSKRCFVPLSPLVSFSSAALMLSSLGFPLRLAWSAPVSVLCSLMLMLGNSSCCPEYCALPREAERLNALAARVHAVAGRISYGVLLAPPRPYAPRCACWAVLAWLQVAVGLLLPSFLLTLMQRAAWRAFLRKQGRQDAAAAGVVAPPAAGCLVASLLYFLLSLPLAWYLTEGIGSRWYGG